MGEDGRERTPALDDPGSREAMAVFLMRLRRSGVRDLAVLRAVEETPRHLFVPQRYRDLAFREVNLPLPCGQTMPDAFFVARLAQAAECRARQRLLEIGAGSGYATAVFARLCGDVTAVERYRSLVVEARARLDALGLAATLRWDDGLAALAEGEAYDRIVVHAVLDRDARALP
ncbi:MAG: protein-L-isoaspartate O-methyltransferase [Rhodoblastus sp.]|nr:MAG: protein-L-isoaspartate O-methyltransferase [Rhodoblastus sp.]